jgi:hypothetical protein
MPRIDKDRIDFNFCHIPNITERISVPIFNNESILKRFKEK